MALPTYTTKWKDEAAWAGIVGSISTIVGLVMADAGVKPELIAATLGLLSGLSRLVLGALLPSPPAEGG